MLTININVTNGLYAGSRGCIICPFYCTSKKGVAKPPDCLLVKFDEPVYLANRVPVLQNIVPIFPVIEGWICPRSGRRVTVKVWPLKLSFSLTQFKSQVG